MLAGRRGEDPKYFFPVRRGRDTRFLTFEQLMRLNEGSHRSMYLRLLEIDADFRPGQSKVVCIKSR